MEKRFPDEIMIKIFTFLDGLSLLQASQVNKQWNHLADNEKLWRLMCLKRWTFCEDYLGIRTWKRFFLDQIKQDYCMALARRQDFTYKISQDIGSGLSIDGQERSIVCGASSRHKLFAWDMQKGAIIWASPFQMFPIHIMITLPQRNLAFTLDSSRTIKVWDCYSADALTAISMTTYGSSMEAFVTESGSFLMVGDSVGDIYTFTVPDLRRVSRAHAFQYNVERLLCSPDKKLIFASGCDEAIFPKVFVTEHLLKKSEKDHLMPCSIPVALCWTACWAPRKANRIAMSRRNIDERVTLITFDFTTKLVDGKTLIEAHEVARFHLPDRYEILSYLAFNDGETIAFVSGWYLFLYTIDGTMLQRLANHRSNICYLWSDPVHVLTTGTDDFLNLYMWKEEGRSSRLVHCCRLQQQPGDWTPRCFTSRAICDNRSIACLVSQDRASNLLVMFSLLKK